MNILIEVVRYYHKWSVEIHFVYDRCSEKWQGNNSKAYYVPRKVVDWLNEPIKLYILKQKNDIKTD